LAIKDQEKLHSTYQKQFMNAKRIANLIDGGQLGRTIV
jgi:hypothetical protein